MIDSIPAPVRTVVLLAASNVFMTFAWYGHLRYRDQRPRVIFAPFALVVMTQPLKLDFLRAALCLVGAVYFVFRSHGG